MTKLAATTFLCLLSLSTLSVARADTPLELTMKQVAKAFHQLTLDLKAPQDADKADYVALATSIKTNSQKAQELIPQKAAALPPDQQAKMVADYKKSMDDLDKAVDVLIADLQAGQWDAASKQLAVLKSQEDTGHKAFRVDKHHQGAPPAPAAPVTAPAAPATPPPAAPPAQ